MQCLLSSCSRAVRVVSVKLALRTLTADTCAQLVARFQRSRQEPRRVTTYIDAMGLAYHNHTIMVQVEGNSSLTGELASPDSVPPCLLAFSVRIVLSLMCADM